jgi:tRNA(adenine34) deaminase
MTADEVFMREALEEAKKGALLGEVPVGAVLVYKGEVIARAHNLVETSRDASAHAEMLCLRQGSQFFSNWRLVGTTLYCTLEPCPMCAGAMILSRLDTLVWGAPDLRHGAHGSWLNLLDVQHPIHQLTVRQGVLKEEAAFLMKDFFRNQARGRNG